MAPRSEASDDEAKRLRALLEAVKFGGFDLLTDAGQRDFADTLARAKARTDRLKGRTAHRAALYWGTVAAIAGTICSFIIPRALQWLTVSL